MPFNSITHSSLAVFLTPIKGCADNEWYEGYLQLPGLRGKLLHLKAYYYSFSQELGRVIQFPLNIPTYLKLNESIHPIFILL